MKQAKVRLYLDHPLAPEETILLSRDHAHYLFGVMRMGEGDLVAVFNGKDGEYTARVIEAGKRKGTLQCVAQTRLLQMPPDLWVCFAPIKKSRTDFIVEKACEMGARTIQPMQTEFTNSERIRRDRLQAHAVEAAEQCGGTFVPEVHDLIRMDKLLATWDPERQIMFCDEALVGVAQTLAKSTAQRWAIFIGPEGGFSETERQKLHALTHAHPVSLGPRILRADTAVVAAMTLWQQALGDW